ncbi:MAG: SDR family oxidoreductase [Alphaproteobacteria bacterium]|nr:SDR family oxidoreductase [Alphaproteobacteria bacterium]
MTNDLFSVAGKVTLITGGGRGIGKMIAAGFVKAGAKVYISSRKQAVCDATAQELSAFGTCISLPVDVSGMDGIKALAAAIAAREPKLDVLIHNAGVAWLEPLEIFPEAKGWDRVVDLNMKTPFFLTQALLPQLRAAAEDRVAKVINIASIDGITVNPQETYSYAASKAGLIHLTRRMANQLAPQNIAVSAIAPGAFASDMNIAARDEGEAVAKRIPARRIGVDDDMAGAAIYLASRAGDYVVGATLIVDGGASNAR